MARPKTDTFERIADEFIKMNAEERTELLGVLRGIAMAEARRPRAISAARPAQADKMDSAAA